MTKTFEEEHIKFNNEYGNCKSAYYQKAVRHHFKDWHSDEEFQEMKESYWNQAESILSMLEEIKSLKSQLQQQALPVVPECVAEWIDKNISVAHNAELMIHNILICAIDNKNRYLFPLEVEKFVLKNPITFLNAIITGKYEVEKPQLFYLKAKELLVVGDYDHVEDLWLDWNKNFTPKKQDAHQFTQKELDSFYSKKYEQVEVTE